MNKRIQTLVAVFAIVAIAGTVAAKPHHRRRRHHTIDPLPVVTQVVAPAAEEAPKPKALEPKAIESISLEATVVIPKVEVQPITPMIEKAIENVSPEIAPVVTEDKQAQAKRIIRVIQWIKSHKVLTAGSVIALLVAADMLQNGFGLITKEQDSSTLKWVTPGNCTNGAKYLWEKRPWKA